jgi:hypothetical protein
MTPRRSSAPSASLIHTYFVQTAGAPTGPRRLAVSSVPLLWECPDSKTQALRGRGPARPYRPGAPLPTAGAGGRISAPIPSSAIPHPVLRGPSQTKAAPAHTPVPCAWGVGMALRCPSGTPPGAGASIYQANPIARHSKHATADFSKKNSCLVGFSVHDIS